jgi:hypothetical protein
MKRGALILVPGLAVLAGACGGQTTDAADVGPAPHTTEAPPADNAGETLPVQISFTNGDEFVPSVRWVADRGSLEIAAADAIRALIAGPTAAERAAGLGTQIPAGTRLLDLTVGDDRVATVDLSTEFETAGDEASIRVRLGQVACTLDEMVDTDIIDRTVFLLDGQRVDVLAGNSIVLSEPVSCSDFAPKPTTGQPSETCVNGWTSPAPGTEERRRGLELLHLSVNIEELFVVEEIRYFTGPQSHAIIEPVYPVVERWYIKARLQSDPSFRGRFLVREDPVGSGVEAVASYDSQGWQSPDWAGFEGDGGPTAYPDLPGEWGGVRYDFVRGAGPGLGGLPPEVEGCLLGT